MTQLKPLRVGTLTVITTLLVFSAGFRLLGVSSAAFALENGSVTSASATERLVSTEPDPDLEKLLTSFRNRESTLQKEEEELSVRLEKLKQVETMIAVKFEELRKAEQRLRNLLSIADNAAEDDVAQLTTVYETMKPKAAAFVFEQMPPDFAAGFLARMTPNSAALVMAELSPQIAYAISVVFAGRHTDKNE
jgi:flagellar motility protein MotE (MotC chaperone)